MSAAIRLKNIVENRGVKLTAISKATGIPVDLISRSFLGKRKLLADEFLSICSFLDLDASSFLKNAGKKKPTIENGSMIGNAGIVKPCDWTAPNRQETERDLQLK